MWCDKIEDRGGGAPSKVVRGQCTVFGGGCTKVHRFITQQPTLLLAEWGVMRGNKRGDERGERRRERQIVTREGWRDMKCAVGQERGIMTGPSKGRCTVLLHSNQPCWDAFLAEWRVISMERGD